MGLGMTLVARSDFSTGNTSCVSHVVQSNDLVFAVTAPQAPHMQHDGARCPLPGYCGDRAFEFLRQHGVAVRAIGIEVRDAKEAHALSTARGAVSVLEPAELVDSATGRRSTIAEVVAYGDVVLRYLSGDFDGPFLPNYAATDAPVHCYGLQRIDHCVGNVPDLFQATDYLRNITGFHEFAEFTAEDVGTVDSGLNSMVLASNSERVLLPVNEPTHGTRRKSQIQTYLEHHGGAGVQHVALATDDIFATLRAMRAATAGGGLDFIAPASAAYYDALPERVGDALSAKQVAEARELGVLVDRDDQGVLLQIFTVPLTDRPTLFFEIIQRIGCERAVDAVASDGSVVHAVEQAGGCGGFGKGNFTELFKSIERQFSREFHE